MSKVFEFNYSKQTNETVSQYIDRVLLAKMQKSITLTWEEIRELFISEVRITKSESAWRKEAKRKFKDVEEIKDISDDPVELMKELLLEYKKERVKLSDERVQNNVYVRKLAREETLREIAFEVAKTIGSKKLLPDIHVPVQGKGTNEAILELSDWHYGIEVDTYWNKYNMDICKQRVSKLLQETIIFCKLFDVRRLHIMNLGDLICGRIHETLRLQSRIDVITQTIEVSEILAEFINQLLGEGIIIEYYDCLDNHSRLEPDKQSSIDLESLVRIIPWYLKERFKGKENVRINKNTYDNDIIDSSIVGYRIGGVHGHKHKQSKVVEGLTLMTKDNYDLICTAHLHHFNCDEKNEVVVVSNGTLMGTDYYAKDLNLSSIPSQNIILVNNKSVVDYIHRVVLK